MMTATPIAKLHKRLRNGFYILHLPLMVVIVASTLVPNFDTYDENLIEITEKSDAKSKDKKERNGENEFDDFTHHVDCSPSDHFLEYRQINNLYYNCTNLYVEIFTPPPEHA